jgi:hypothetical protein
VMVSLKKMKKMKKMRSRVECIGRIFSMVKNYVRNVVFYGNVLYCKLRGYHP